MNDLMPIGQFSQVSRLSVKALRLYDAEGLLTPAWVDPTSGYRHYEAAQVARAEAIRVLRMVDMPLCEIRELLVRDDIVFTRERLAEHRALLAGRLADQERMLRFLERLIQKEHIAMPYDVTTKEVGAQRVAGARVRTTLAEIGDAIGRGVGALMGSLGAAGVEPTGMLFTIYHDVIDEETDGDIEVCIPVPPGSTGPGGEVEWKDVPAAEVASTTHQGPYMEVGTAYQALASWMQDNGREHVGPPRELYLNDPQEVAESELLTEVQIPLAWR